MYIGHVLRMPESRVVRRALMPLTEADVHIPGAEAGQPFYGLPDNQSHSRLVNRALNV